MNLPLTSAAEADLTEAMLWYEAKQPGLGIRLVDVVEQVLRDLADSPEQGRLEGDDPPVRSVPKPVFPYRVYYAYSAARWKVFAIYHTSREPDGWRGRL